MEPRKPTEEEKKELFEFVLAHQYKAEPTSGDREEAASLVDDSAYIAVFDDYTTGCPGYSGRIMVVVWDGSPSFTETFIWERPILPEDEDKYLGQIDWHDGKHEPKLTKVTIDQNEAA